MLREGERSAGITARAKVAGPSNIGNYLAGLGVPATAGFGVTYEGLHGTDERIPIDSIPSVQSAYHQARRDLGNLGVLRVRLSESRQRRFLRLGATISRSSVTARLRYDKPRTQARAGPHRRAQTAMQTRELTRTHDVIDPAILYFGTPVVLLSTVSAAGAVNLMPMSSAFWLGHTGVLGMGTRSQTYRNLADTGECVLNLPSAALVAQVNRLALTTGRDPVPSGKASAGYQYEPDKFGRAGLTAVPAETVRPPRAAECPVNLEARVAGTYELERDDSGTGTGTGSVAVEVAITRVHVHPGIRLPGTENRIDSDAWRPLIMSFQYFYGLGDQLHPSKLATIDEEWYR